MQTSFKCLKCDKSFDKEASLHSHIKCHDLTVESYFHTLCPRYDLWDSSLIEFRNKEFYLGSDFNSRTNLISWLTQKAAPEEARIYAKELLAHRKEEKGLVYALCHTELRSLPLPSVEYFERAFGDYNQVCSDMGLKPRFIYKQKLEFNQYDKDKFVVLRDTREQDPLDLDVKTLDTKLDVGDYSITHSDYFNNLFIERKSIADFIGTLSKGYERFASEIQRAQAMGAHLVVLVEATLKDSLAFDTIAGLPTRATPCFIFHRVRELMQKFLNIQFAFVDGRPEMARVVKRLLLLKTKPNTVDVQYCLDKKLL